MNLSKSAKYIPFPQVSPYTTKTRYKKPKENFKCAIEKLRQLTDKTKVYTLVDIGCANGEFLYYVKQCYPKWKLFGYDFTQEFIETAKTVPFLADVSFQIKNLFDIVTQYDIVTCFGTLPIFPDIKKPLGKLISLTKKNGWIIAEGLFNKYRIDVRMIYRDDSVDCTRGIWRKDFNQHSQERISTFLKQKKVASFYFEPVSFGVEIPVIADKPHANVFTFRDGSSKILVTNGMNLLLNSTLLVIKK